MNGTGCYECDEEPSRFFGKPCPHSKIICELSDLPVEQCACRIHKPKPKRPDNLSLLELALWEDEEI